MSKPRHIAIVIDLEWPLKHHHATYAGIHRYAEHHGWRYTVWPQAPKSMEVRPGRKQRYDGIIARVTPELAKRANAAGVPLVNIWLSSPVTDVPTVAPDMHRCGWMAAEHMLARGLTKLGYLAFRGSEYSREQLRGFKGAIEVAGVSECRVLNVPTSYSSKAAMWDKFHDGLIDWINTWEPPFGVYTAVDILARYMANVANEKELSVPGDVAIVGTGNETVVCLSPDPTLSSIDEGYERVGYRAAQLLSELLDGAPPPTKPIILPPAKLAARASTDAFAVDDVLVAKALRFMTDESHRPIKVADVVDHVHASHRSLVRHFKDARGRSIIDELARIRIGRAKRMLVESEHAVKEVAAACGYGTSNRLCDSFRKTEGITPGEYRRTHAVKAGIGALG